MNYLSMLIDKTEQRIDNLKKNPNLSNSDGWKYVLKKKQQEFELLNNILNKLTEVVLS